MNTNRPVLALAAVLAATVLTGGAAILGIAHHPAQAAAPASAVQSAVVQQAPVTHSWTEGGD